MRVWVVALISAVVNFLTLLGASRLCGSKILWVRFLFAACFGGLYSGLCASPGFRFLASPMWYALSLICGVLIGWGLNRATLRRGAVFAVLRLAIEGIAQGVGNGGAVSLLLASAGLGILCIVGFRGELTLGKFVPVEISRGDRHLHLTALRDTGNTLRDPLTGQPVLVIGAQSAQMLTGLSREQLRNPVDTIGLLPGLQLVPYRAIGKENGLMLAQKFQNVRIGKWKGSSLVAFAPEGLGGDEYDALTGGTL